MQTISHCHLEQLGFERAEEIYSDCLHLTTVSQLIKTLENGDVLSSALARQKASNILATDAIDLSLRQTLADHLNQANLFLALKTTVGDDSY